MTPEERAERLFEDRGDALIYEPSVRSIADEIRAVMREAYEDAARECSECAAAFDNMLDDGKGEHGTPGYVRDDTWQNWIGSRSTGVHLSAAILRRAKEVCGPAETDVEGEGPP